MGSGFGKYGDAKHKAQVLKYGPRVKGVQRKKKKI
jgi:hypothetical protein